MMRKVFLPLLALALLFWVAGCSNNPSQTDTTADTPNLEEDFGGYTATDDEPGFGDPALLAASEGEEDFDDTMLGTPAVDSVIADVDAGMFHFRAVWGQLCYDSTVVEKTDWSGSLSITRGAEIIRKIIRFEPGQDYIEPRTDRTLIEWVSFTTVHNDGIGVDIFVPKGEPVYDTSYVVDTLFDTTMVIDTIPPEPVYDTSYVVDTLSDTTMVIDTIPPEPVTLTFATGPYTRTFTLNELASLDTIVYLDDSSAVSFYAMQYYRNWCARGFLAGNWGFDSTGMGVFEGIWMSHVGYVTGWLKGNFGVNDDGQRVFYGKWIDNSGQFEGLLRGTYRPIGANFGNGRFETLRKGGGAFEGKIYDAEETEIGILKGRYHSMPMWKTSYFQGRWKVYCPEEFRPDSSRFDDGM